jgi:hypothetical protein
MAMEKTMDQVKGEKAWKHGDFGGRAFIFRLIEL